MRHPSFLVRCAAAAASAAFVAALAVACSDDDRPEGPPATSAVATAAGGDAAATPAPVTYAEPGPATFTVIGGRSEGPIDIEAFLPYSIHIRQGDSIEWVSEGYEGHTITFAPPNYLRTMGGYLVEDPLDPEQMIFNDAVALRSETGDVFTGDGTVFNSGFIGVPVEATYKLTFAEKGIFEYVCLVHPLWMYGTVSVDDADAQVEAPESVLARAEAEFERLIADSERVLAEARAQQDEQSVPAPDGAQLHRVRVGLTTHYGQIAVFVNNTLEIDAGDTVLFVNDERNFHNVIFKGAMEKPPPAYDVRIDPDGRGLNVALAKESARAVHPPPEGFDDQTFLSSGTMGILQDTSTWRLTFDNPGTYVYNCTIHDFAGMAGVIVVR